MFSKILIANRGEIAVRIARTCRTMGIQTVAVYSEADAGALHVRVCDEAYCIGSAPAVQSYLRQDLVLEVAAERGVDAVHPGYGFLAENAAFARSVQESGLVWIGPPPEVVALMGDKPAAKDFARAAGLPVIPGYVGEHAETEGFLREAAVIGYPVMIKAAAGGGGKGMRVVDDPAELVPALEGAEREARSAFGDGRLFLEKYLTQPRHIEVQVLADSHGNVVHLGERECSLQRRHQKVIEEAPSPALTADLRQAMTADAVRLCRRSNYANAGTVEFLFSADSYYFLEMNTRIQVEHPVTELTIGVDMVKLQIEIAAGAKLPFSQSGLQARGHAVEARLYAEDSSEHFLPSTGTLKTFRLPCGPGIRVDTGFEAGDEVTPYYDPMLAKIVVHASDRATAVSGLQDAIASFSVVGVTTNGPFLRWLINSEDFRTGRMDVNLIDRVWQPPDTHLPDAVLWAAAAFELTSVSSDVNGGRGFDPYNPWLQSWGWRPSGLPRQFKFECRSAEYEVRAHLLDGNRWRMDIDQASTVVEIQASSEGRLLLIHEGHVFNADVARLGNDLAVCSDGTLYVLRRASSADTSVAATDATALDTRLSAPMPGTVVKVEVEPGQRVKRSEELIVLEAMKMEHTIVAPHDGIVLEVLCSVGDLVPSGTEVVRIEAVG